MKNFYKDLKELTTKIIKYRKLRMLPLTKKENKLHKMQKLCYVCRKKFNNKTWWKVRDLDHYTRKYSGASHVICNLRYKNSNEIPLILHNGSNYDYHLIIKELAKEFKGQFKHLG